MKLHRAIIFCIFTSLLIPLHPNPAWAGSGGGAIVYTFNTSARHEGMGGAGVGSPWGEATNHWANPAQLAYRQGLQVEWYKSLLAVGLADDIYMRNDEIIFGYAGVGIMFNHLPAEGAHLDMGMQQGMDENGDPTGVFHSYMKSQSFGLGLDLVQMADHYRSRKGEPSNWAQFGSLSVGYVRKSFEDYLAPDEIIQDGFGGGQGKASTYDLGWCVRVTPLNTLDRGHPMVFLLGAAYGSSTLNGGDEMITHVNSDQSNPLPRAHVNGCSVHGEVAVGRPAWNRNFSGILEMLYHTFNPLLSITWAQQKSQPGYIWNPDTQEYTYEHDKRELYDDLGKGWEVSFANIFYKRVGRVDAIYGDVDDDTEGWGINFQVGQLCGLRYDKATVPQAQGLSDVERESWAIWVNPLAEW